MFRQSCSTPASMTVTFPPCSPPPISSIPPISCPRSRDCSTLIGTPLRWYRWVAVSSSSFFNATVPCHHRRCRGSMVFRVPTNRLCYERLIFNSSRRIKRVITFILMSMTVLLRCQPVNQVPALAIHSKNSCRTLKGEARRSEIAVVLNEDAPDRFTLLHQ